MARPKSGHPDPAPASIDDLVKELRPVVRRGLDNTTARPELSELQCVQERAVAYPADDDGLSHAWRDVIRTALDALGDNDRSNAIRLLLGAEPETSALSAAERRNRAAAILNIAASTLRKNYEPKLLREVAEQIYRLEHQPDAITTLTLNAPDGIVALDDIIDPVGDEPLTDGEPTADRPSPDKQPADTAKRSRVPREIGGGRGIPPIFVRTNPQLRQVYNDLRSDLRDIRDQHQRRLWLAVIALGGTLIALRYGLDALPRYAAVVSVVGLGKYLTEVVAQWRTVGTAAIDDRLPQITICVMVAALSASFIAISNEDNDDRASDSCYLSAGNPDCASATTSTTVEVFNRVPTTHATPGPPVEPECPPPGNTERRISFTTPPPLCIDPDSTYIASVETNYGTFEMELNASEATYTVNNFVFLARWHFYDGVTLNPYPLPQISASYLASDNPVAPEDIDQAPGYGMTLEGHEGAYPDGIYAIIASPENPHLWSLVIGDEAREQIETEGQRYAIPVLGRVTDCEDIISDPVALGPGLQPRFTSAPIVIDTIAIRELRPGTTTSTTRLQDPHCREEQQAQLEQEYGGE